jgi:hypothetical protein
MSGVCVSNRTKIVRWAGMVGAAAVVTAAVPAPASRAADQPVPANNLFPYLGLARWSRESSLAKSSGDCRFRSAPPS